MELMEAIRGRRSVRKFEPDPVSEEILKTILEAVRWSPSWANTQCWELIIVQDPTVKSELAKTLSETNPGVAALNAAPLAIVFCAKKGVSGSYKGQVSTEKGDWLMFDIGIAMQDFCLAAHALGLGTVIIGLFNHRKVAEIMGVPSHVDVVAMTPLGYPATKGNLPKRREAAEFVFHEHYGNR